MKLHPPGSPEGIVTTQTGGSGTSDPGRITIVNRTMHRLLIEAYGVKGYQLQDPLSLDQVRYDVTDKTPPGATEQDVNLLIERLKLKVRRESKVVPVWALVVAKGGPKFKHSCEAAPPNGAKMDSDGFPVPPIDRVNGGIYRSTNNAGALKITAVKQTMAQFVSALFGQADRPVMDMTELHGRYDFSVIFGAR
jgi:uncharacterized protein (TIGR03435 family)